MCINPATPFRVAIKSHLEGDGLGDTSEREIPERLELVGIAGRNYLSGSERDCRVILDIKENPFL